MGPFTIAELTDVLSECDELETPYQRRVQATLLFLLEGQRDTANLIVAHGERLSDIEARLLLVEQLSRVPAQVAADMGVTMDLARGRSS